MPNVGRPSRDCHSCRQRRIKCDLVLPWCNQCLRNGHLCPGYRDNLSTSFLIQTVSSFPSYIREDHRKKSSRRGELTYAVNKKRGPKGPVASEWKQPLWYPLAETWADHVIPIAMDKFAFSCNIFATVQIGILSTQLGSALYLATYALGCAYLAKLTPSDQAISSRVKAYATALSAMNIALQDPQQYKTDETLLGVWLLGIYELLTDTPDSGHRFAGWDIHNQGLIEIIRQRGLEQFKHQNGRNLFYIVFNTMQSRVLLPDQAYFTEALQWFKTIHDHCGPSEYPLLRAYIFCYHCVRICSRINGLLNTSDIEMLATLPSVLQDISIVESETLPFVQRKRITEWVIKTPMVPYNHVIAPYISIYVLQSNYRLRVSCYILKLLNYASEVPDCTPKQQELIFRTQRLFTEEIRILQNKISGFLPLISDSRFYALEVLGAGIFLHQPTMGGHH